VDVLLCNAAELQALYRADTLHDAIARLDGQVRIAAVTRGAEGASLCYDGECVGVAAHPVREVVDTTGAGDQFAAGFLWGLARGRSLEECGGLGALAAAEVIAHIGPRPQASLADLARRQGLL
jgi:sugar/nucleoside kinase (ribokinase family)